jgi:glycosyltransferase involved in cell wall biosynthesis
VRILLCLHHRLDPDAGAPGITLALGGALEAVGCEVAYFAYDQAFPRSANERVGHRVRFPWRVTAFLARRAGQVDVVDAASGDAWLWAALRRPGGGGRTALVTRAHGLENVADERRRRAAPELGARLSWKYPLYHGGLRLWEERRSLVLADHCVLANPGDRDYVRDRLGVPAERLSVLPSGVGEHFLDAPAPEPAEAGPLRLAYVGAWSERKGRRVLAEVVGSLQARGVDFSLRLLGTGDEAAVLSSLPEAARPRVAITPAFANQDLPALLAGQEVFLFPTLFEGASVALLEAMACGLAPVATTVGSAPDVVVDGEEGVLVEPGDPSAIVAALERLARDRGGLLEMRRRARRTARSFGWHDIAARTVRVYERVVAARSTASTKRGPTRSQV